MKSCFRAACVVLALVAASAAQVPALGHVFVVVEENNGYSSVIGSSSMPYLNSLASQYGLATQYYANTHPSIGNYFMMTCGQIITNDDSYSSTVTVDNIVRHLIGSGKTWKSYAEDLPSVGYTGDGPYPYARKHNPLSFYSDVVNSSNQVNNLVPFSQFPTDLNNNQLPNYSFIVPNLCNDAHDCSLSTADSWLQQNIAPLLASSTFQQDGLLIITFDEAESSDTSHGGGHVATVVVSPKSKAGYQSTTFYQHQSLLRTTMAALGLTSFPGAASSAPDMGEFFTTSTTTTTTPTAVLTVTPQTGTAPLNVTADSSGSSDSGGTLTSRSIDFGDGTVANNTVTATHTYNTAGSYTVTLTVTDSSGKTATATQNVTVSAPAVTCTPSTVNRTVTICSPAAGTVSSPVRVVASATDSATVKFMYIYVDGAKVYQTNRTKQIDTNVNISSGTHTVKVQAKDSSGTFSSSVSITVP